MSNYSFIDADAHVEECEDTWNYLDAEFLSQQPVAVTLRATRVFPPTWYSTAIHSTNDRNSGLNGILSI